MRLTRFLHIATFSLMLSSASVAAMAGNGIHAAANGDSGCSDNEATASERARDVAESKSKPTATRSSKAAASARATASGGRGGGGEDSTPARASGAKWHSFLPGMFR